MKGMVWAALLAVLAGAGCTDGHGEGSRSGPPETERILAEATERIEAFARTMDEALHPLPLLTAREEQALRRYPNRVQLERARTLGVPRAGDTDRLLREGRLVRLEDSTAYWVVRELDFSEPLLTPDAVALLTEIGQRFQEELDGLGLPPLRLEVTSALRSAAMQARLRQQNANATREVSTHEYGTTFDLAYNGFTAPAQPALWLDAGDETWLQPFLARHTEALIERAAGRRSHELKALLGKVLADMQSEGKVMVTLEERQPVFHMTVAKRLAGPP